MRLLVKMLQSILRIRVLNCIIMHMVCLVKGLTLLDTKFEFGYDEDEKIVLIDEIFTPDCSHMV